MADCEARGKILAIIDTPEKFNIIYDLLTNNGRYELIYIRGRGINDNYLKNSKYLSFNFFSISLNWSLRPKKVAYCKTHFFCRGMPSAPVYIGLKYNTVNKQHEWLDGTPVTWVNWYINEPFSVETRHCVRLDLDSNLQYRTTDCTYQHNYVCSSEGGMSVWYTCENHKTIDVED